MAYSDISTLVEKFWECETTEEEEQTLADYYESHANDTLPDDIEEARPFFVDDDDEDSDWFLEDYEDDFDENEHEPTAKNDPLDDEDEDEDVDGFENEEQAEEELEERSPFTIQLDEEFFKQFEPFDDHSMWPDCDTDDEKEQMNQVIDDMLVFAAEEVEKAHGKIPGELVERIEAIKNKKRPKPVADWKRYFRRYLGNEFSEFIRKSKKRESRRFPDAAGNRHRRKSHILVAIDTSGSVSMPEYMEFFGQIQTLTATADFHVLECDARIQYEYDYRGKPNETLHGGGGTDFSPVTKYFNEHRKQYDALVYFTDGYCEIPSDTSKDTLWVISSQGDQSDRKRYQVNGASVTFIPKHE